jgi:hypothetical protein
MYHIFYFPDRLPMLQASEVIRKSPKEDCGRATVRMVLTYHISFFVFRIASGAIRKKQKKGGESVLSDRKHTTRRHPRMQPIGGGKTKKAIWKSQRTRRIEYQKLSREMTMTIS